MINECDVIVLEEDLNEYELRRGALGVALIVHPDGGCEAEFLDDEGWTIAVVTLGPTRFRPAGPAELPGARNGRPAGEAPLSPTRPRTP